MTSFATFRNARADDLESYKVKIERAHYKIDLYKTEMIRARGATWKGLDYVEYATPLGNVPPDEFERIYYGEDNRSCLAA